MAPILGYWNLRGLATPIRLLLEYAGQPYEEKLYECGPPPEFDRSEWLKDKFNLGIDLPNLPYYIDGDVKLAQSGVIMAYLGKKHNLAGKTEADQFRVQMCYGHVYDLIMEYARVVYNPMYATLRKDLEKVLPDRLKVLTEFLGERKFVTGDEVTYADFALFEYLERIEHLSKETLESFPVLVQYRKRILGLDAVDKYFKSPRAIKYPHNGAPAYIGGPYSDQLTKSA